MEQGFKLMTDGTENHLMLIDATKKGLTGKEAEVALDKAGITVNKNTIPFDMRKPYDPSGIRLGTPALTTRGMKEPEMRQIAVWINEVFTQAHDAEHLEKIRKEIQEFTKKFPLYTTISY